MLASSERIAGEQGSALHSLVFLRNTERLTVDIIERYSDLPASRRNRNDDTIAATKGFVQRTHCIKTEKVIRHQHSVVDKIVQNSFHYLDALDVPIKMSARTKHPAGSSFGVPGPSPASNVLRAWRR